MCVCVYVLCVGTLVHCLKSMSTSDFTFHSHRNSHTNSTFLVKPVASVKNIPEIFGQMGHILHARNPVCVCVCACLFAPLYVVAYIHTHAFCVEELLCSVWEHHSRTLINASPDIMPPIVFVVVFSPLVPNSVCCWCKGGTTDGGCVLVFLVFSSLPNMSGDVRPGKRIVPGRERCRSTIFNPSNPHRPCLPNQYRLGGMYVHT